MSDKPNAEKINYHQASLDINACMLEDTFTFSRALQRIKKEPNLDKQHAQWANLKSRIDASKQRHQHKISQRPNITYPENLPVVTRREDIIETIKNNQVTIICGETGSGKSTQLPKFLLEAGYGIQGMIAHTQPRRIAARSLATRISEELGTELGQAVGYKVRFNDNSSKQSYIKLLTDGMLLSEMSEDRFLNAYDAIIVDEAHERSLNIDILLGLLNTLIKKRPQLKLIITSATINSQIFAQFFAKVKTNADNVKEIIPAPVLEVSGRTYPVSINYRPLIATDYPNQNKEDAWLSHIKKITQKCLDAHNGDILFFLPTERDINDVHDYFHKHLRHYIERLNVKVLRLYARLALSEQQMVLQTSNAKHAGTRIILSTNIAETSLTVPNIRYVIDAGTARILRFNPARRISQLPIEKISQASANQRSGRSGRVQDGICFRLYDQDDFNNREEYSQPEIARSSLTEVILKLKSLHLDIETFQWLEAPQQRLITDGLRELSELGALNSKQQLTVLGKQLIQIPIDTRIARILLASNDYHCFADVAVIAAFLSTQDPRIINNDNRSQARAKQKIFDDGNSDFIVLLNIWQTYIEKRHELSQRKLRQWCEDTFLSWNVLNECRLLVAEFDRIAKQLKFTIKGHKRNPDNIHKALLTGFLSNIAKRDSQHQGAGELYQGAYDKKVRIFPGSILAKKKNNWIVCGEQLETSALFARYVASINPLWIEAAAEHLIHYDYLAPFWHAARGEVSCQVTKRLFGIILSNNSYTNYGKINADSSQDILVQHLLLDFNDNDDFSDSLSDHESEDDKYDRYDNYLSNNHRSNTPERIAQDNKAKEAPHPLIHKIKKHSVLAHNRALFRQIETLEHKLRHHNIRHDDTTIVAWFKDKLPKHAVSATQLWQFLQDQHSSNTLKLSILDLLIDGDENINIAESRPDTISVLSKNQQPLTLPLTYTFDARSAFDGITVTILLSQLNQLSADTFEWLIPAWLDEKILGLLKRLPKSLKQKLPPVKSLFDAIKKQLLSEYGTTAIPSPVNIGLQQYLSNYLIKQHKINNSYDFWQQEDGTADTSNYLDNYLQAHYRLVDNDNQMVAESSDLYQLQLKFHHLSQQSLQSRAPFSEIRGATDWQFGVIEKQIMVMQQDQEIAAFPALQDEGNSVRYFLSHNQQSAVSQSKNAITRLLILHLPSQVSYIIKKLPELKKITTLYASIGSSSKLVNDLVFRIFKQTYFGENAGANQDIVRSEAEFIEFAQQHRDQLLTHANQLLQLVLSIVENYQHCRHLADKLQQAGFDNVSEDIHEHLDWLIYEDFVEETPLTWLQQFPRYLKAIELRAERAQSNPQKDVQKSALIAPFWQAYIHALTEASEKIDDVNAFSEYGWALEEYRLSLYAQEMKTVIPVSTKKLQQLWQQATRLPL